MSKLTFKQRKKLSASKFVFPVGTKAHPARKSFPVDTKARARNALARAAQKQVKLTAKERCRVVKVVCAKHPDIGICAGVSYSKKLSGCPLPRR